MPSSNRNSRGSWHGQGRGTSSRGHGFRCSINETEVSDTSKPLDDSTKSEVDMVRLLQVYGTVPSKGTELKRRKQVIDESSTVNSLALEFTLPVPMPLVLHGAPLEADIDVQWETCDTILPIQSCITKQLIQMECNIPRLVI